MRAIVDGDTGNKLETDVTEQKYAHDEVNHFGLRTCDWTHRLEPLPSQVQVSEAKLRRATQHYAR